MSDESKKRDTNARMAKRLESGGMSRDEARKTVTKLAEAHDRTEGVRRKPRKDGEVKISFREVKANINIDPKKKRWV